MQHKYTLSSLAAVVLASSSGVGQQVAPEEARLFGSDAQSGNSFSASIAFEGDTVLASTPEGGAGGVVYAFERAGGTWSEVDKVLPSTGPGTSFFGAGLALSGDRAAISCRVFQGGSFSGHAFTYLRSGSTWAVEQELAPADGEHESFGDVLAIDADTAVVGSPRDDEVGEDAGAAYVFERQGGVWQQTQKLLPTVPGDVFFGGDLALDGDRLVVGPYGEVFERSGSLWVRAARLSDVVSESIGFFASLALDGERVVGASRNVETAWVFERSGGVWIESATLRSSDAFPSFGSSVGLEADLLAVGARPGATVFRRTAGVWHELGGLAAEDTTTFFGRQLALSAGAVLVSDAAASGAVAGTGAAFVFRACGSELGSGICEPAVVNSLGVPGRMSVWGSATTSDDCLVLTATDLPPGNIGYFIMGSGSNTFTPPGSVGPICVAPGIRRFLPPVDNTNALAEGGGVGGGFTRSVGTSGAVSDAIVPGSTWGFQAWHRDGMSPSNLTSAVRVGFQ